MRWSVLLQRQYEWRSLHQRCFSSGRTRKKRELTYEHLLALDKSYHQVMQLKELLLKEPENVVSIAELAKLRTPADSEFGRSHFLSVVSRYPAFFDLYQDETKALWFGFSPQAHCLVEKEILLAESYETTAVQKLQKLLMMAVNGCISVFKLSLLRQHLGLPADFHRRMVYAYPQYFKVLAGKDGPLLKLIYWDSTLAISSLEKRAADFGELSSTGAPLFRMHVPKTFKLSREEQHSIQVFQQLPFISPYEDARGRDKSKLEFEKRQVALLHEILSLTLEKKIALDFLTHFRKEYKLPSSLLELLRENHRIFYVCHKGGQFTVFLKEAYEGVNLLEKNEWNLLKEQYVDLMKLHRQTEQS